MRSADDVLRALFPGTFQADAAPDYVSGWCAAVLADVPRAEVRGERAYLSARRTALALGGCWVTHLRGTA